MAAALVRTGKAINTSTLVTSKIPSSDERSDWICVVTMPRMSDWLTATSQINGVSPAVADLSLRSDQPGPVVGVELAWLLPFCAVRAPEGRAPPVPPSA